MNKDRKPLYVSLLALIIAVVGISIAYAALSTSLKVNFGEVTRHAFVWDVKLKNETVTGISSGTSGTTCGTVTVTDSSTIVDEVTLDKPGDKCVYPITVQNKGDIDANLLNVAATSPRGVSCDSSIESKLVCGNIVYQLTSDAAGTTLLRRNNQRISKTNGISEFYLVVSYEVSGNALNIDATHTDAGFTLVYGQDS